NSRLPRGRPGFDSRPMQLALLLSFPRLSPGPKKDKRSGTLSPSGNRTPVSRVTGGDTHHYTKEEEAASSHESFLHFVKFPTHVRQDQPLPSPRECSTPSDLQGIACVKNDELKMHLAVLEGVCLGVLKVHIKYASRLAEHLPIYLQGMNRARLLTATTLADRALSGAGIHIPWGGRYPLCLLRQHTPLKLERY